MSESTKAALAASVAAGYLLGRRRNAKLAMAVATYLVSKKLRAKPQDLLAAGAGKLGGSPQLSKLAEQVRGEVLGVGREALKAAADRRLGSFADALADRTKSLNGVLEELPGAPGEGEEEDEGPEAEEGREAEEDREAGGEEEAEGGGTPAAERRSRPRRPPREPRPSAEKQAPAAKKTAAKKTAKKAPPKKAAKKTTKTTAQKKPPAESSSRR